MSLSFIRSDGRQSDDLRPIEIITDYIAYPEGSILFKSGNTQVLCNATIENGVPKWLENSGRQEGWVTAEYAMLPRATLTRTNRDNGSSSRSQEIKRLIGRSLRAAVDLPKLAGYTITLDCDVLQADGGTRTAAINGAVLALAIAIHRYAQQGLLPVEAFSQLISAVSVGIVAGVPLLDLAYCEDSQAETDMNLVMTADDRFIEIQGTAEGQPYSSEELNQLLNLGRTGIQTIRAKQTAVLDALPSRFH
jgi:ribonuclease PH